VQAWTPPTTEHQALKDFMIEQLTGSMKFDDFHWEPPHRLTGTEWLAAEREKAKRDIEYYTQEVAKERERVRSANEWLQQLTGSL
jgi:hypothetical protein